MKKLIILLARSKRTLYRKVFKLFATHFGTDYYWPYVFHTNGLYRSDYRFDKQQIAFVHLPKTGGTSFAKLLSQDSHNQFTNVNIHKTISKHCPTSKFKYITILRNTVDRVWSQYQMVLRNSEDYPYYKYAQQGLESFLTNCWAVRNMACRQYSGNITQEPNKITLNKAFENLQHFDTVINFENFVKEATMFLEMHNIEVTTIPHKRKAKYPLPSEAEIRLIEKFNAYDISLLKQWRKVNSE